MIRVAGARLVVLLVAVGVGCGSDAGSGETGADTCCDVDGVNDTVADVEVGGDDVSETTDGPGAEDFTAPTGPVAGVDPPPRPPDELRLVPPTRTPDGDAPTEAEIAAFTRRLMAFFRDTDYFDWVYRMTHGLDASYDPAMMPYRLWWQDTSMRREGDTLVFAHRKYAENIAKRSIKLLAGAAAGHLLTGDERMAELAAGLMRGMVALSLGFENQREDPLVKYLQARAIFNHDHSYEVDGRRVAVEYGGTHEASGKWNVHAFEIPDNPEYGTVWASNARSKDDVPYMFASVAIATRTFYATEHPELKEAARLYVEYMRGFAQSIVDNDWFILTRYDDGLATIAVDTTTEGSPPADLGSFVHWQSLFGPDAECTAQVGAALAGYGYLADKGHCERGLVGQLFESFATTGNWFNHNIYNYFHIAAFTTAQLWGHQDEASALLDGLVERFETILLDPQTPNSDHKEFASDSAGWLLAAAAQGYPLNAREARHVMQWYGDSADWYLGWEHWDPWTSLPDGGDPGEFKPPRDTTVPDGQGGEKKMSHVRIVEMPYVFEYCYSPLKAPNGVAFIDCDIVADPSRWGE